MPHTTGKAPERDVKRRLLDAAASLLQECGDPERITTRQITERAGTALGLVNYHFGSRSNLMAQAIEACMGQLAQGMREKPGEGATPKEQLTRMLCELVDFGSEHLPLMQTSVRHTLATGAVDAQETLLPLLRAHFGTSRPESALRLVAHQMVTVLQLAALHPDAFKAFTGYDLMDRTQRNQAIAAIVDGHLAP